MDREDGKLQLHKRASSVNEHENDQNSDPQHQCSKGARLRPRRLSFLLLLVLRLWVVCLHGREGEGEQAGHQAESHAKEGQSPSAGAVAPAANVEATEGAEGVAAAETEGTAAAAAPATTGSASGGTRGSRGTLSSRAIGDGT